MSKIKAVKLKGLIGERLDFDTKINQEIRAVSTEFGNYIIQNDYTLIKDTTNWFRKLFGRPRNALIQSKSMNLSPELLYLMAVLHYNTDKENLFEKNRTTLTKEKANEITGNIKEVLLRVLQRGVEIDDEEMQNRYVDSVKNIIEKGFDKKAVKSKATKALINEEGYHYYFTESYDEITNRTFTFNYNIEGDLILREITYMYLEDDTFKLESVVSVNKYVFTDKQVSEILKWANFESLLENELTEWESKLMFINKKENNKEEN